MESTTVDGVDDTDTLEDDTAQLTPVNDDEEQPTLTVPVNPPTPVSAQLRVTVAGVWPGSTRKTWGAFSQLSSTPGPNTGVTEVHVDAGPKQASLAPLAMTM